jgi:radical SAM/Cys-rich protein
MQDTRPILLANTDFPAITRNALSTLQINLGYLCNMSCVHCHVNAGPTRTEEMDSETADLLIEVLKRRSIGCLDLTGGAPEMNAHFRRIVKAARSMGVEVIDRCNLTILLQPGYEDLADFLAEQGVTVTASLPCYTEDNVEKQRGKGAYEESIEALQMLNRLGYGSDAKLKLNLVYNPVGPHLPPSQQALELDYKRELKQQHDIIFNSLFTITNVPIARFGAVLLAHNQYDDYLSLLKDNYASENLESVMCRDLISVDWRGNLYDCDFNQMLDIPMRDNSMTENQIKLVEKKHLRDLLQSDYASNAIRVADHCYACTAGQGSSCSGAL